MVLLAPTIIPKTGARELFPATASLACAFYGEAVVGWPCGLVAPIAATRLFGPRRVCTTRFHLVTKRPVRMSLVTLDRPRNEGGGLLLPNSVQQKETRHENREDRSGRSICARICRCCVGTRSRRRRRGWWCWRRWRQLSGSGEWPGSIQQPEFGKPGCDDERPENEGQGPEKDEVSRPRSRTLAASGGAVLLEPNR
jgi:hypothetical protein